MNIADHGIAAGHTRRLGLALGPVIPRVRRLTGQYPVLLAVAMLVVGGGAAAGAAVAWNLSSSVPTWVASDCGSGVSGQGFRVFACMSGGARVGHPHPKELLIIRSDRSTVAYPASQIWQPVAGDGEVAATYDGNLIRVTSTRLVPLLTYGELLGVLHARLIWPISALRVNARGDIRFVASFMSRSGNGCQNRILERTARGTVHQIRALPSSICS